MRTDVETCPHRTGAANSDKGPFATCRLISQVVGVPTGVARAVCDQCVLDDDAPTAPRPDGKDIRSSVARRQLLSLAGNHKSDARLLQRCGRTRSQLIEECRIWGYSEEEIAASLIRGRQIADEVIAHGGKEEDVVQLSNIESAAIAAKLFENG